MREVLLAAEFLNPQAPEHVLKELRRGLVHARITEREAQLWLSAFEHLHRVTSGRASR
jgi:tRNA/rRNA methyltransferase